MHPSVTTGEVRPSNKAVVRLKTAAAEAGVSIATFRRFVKAGRGPRIVRLSDRVHGVRRCDLDAWIESRTSAA